MLGLTKLNLPATGLLADLHAEYAPSRSPALGVVTKPLVRQVACSRCSGSPALGVVTKPLVSRSPTLGVVTKA